jgi:hypothetical protein
VITFEILALVVVLRSPFVQYWFSGMQTAAANWMFDVSMIIDNKELADFRNEIAPHMQNLNSYQKEYLLQITESKYVLRNFDNYYCQNNDKNPFIFGASLRYLCSEIGRKGLLKDHG